MDDKVTILKPQPGMQEKIIQYDDVYEIFTGGMAGPGKSWIILYAEIPYILEYPHLRTLFLRRKMPELGELLQEAQQMYCTDELQATMTQVHKFYKRPCFTFPKFKVWKDDQGNITDYEAIPGTEGAILVFGHMIKENTKFDYGGFQFPHIRYDELCNFTESQYLFLMSRNRGKVFPDAPEKNIVANIRGTGNPVGEGRGWVKRRFIDPLETEEVGAFKVIEDLDTRVPIGTKYSKTRMFIPGYRDENKHIGEDYEATLHQNGSQEGRALREGGWEDYDAEDQLIHSAWWEFAKGGKGIEKCPIEYRNQWNMGVDAAYMGKDQSVILTGFENQPRSIMAYPQTAGQDLAWLVDQQCLKIGKKLSVIGLDSVGVGTSASDFLESGGDNIKLKMPGMRGISVKINSRCRQLYRCATKDPKWEEAFMGDNRFMNFRSQAYWQLREDFQNGTIDLSYLVRSAGNEQQKKGFRGRSIGDILNLLEEEIKAIHYTISNGRVVIQPKDEIKKPENLGRSPDFADALAYWNWVRQREAPRSSLDSTVQHPADVAKPYGELENTNKINLEEDDYDSIL